MYNTNTTIIHVVDGERRTFKMRFNSPTLLICK